MQERITTAGILIQNGKYLVAKREEKGSIGGLWEFPGGKNRYTETEEETLKREFQEELGLSISVGPLIHTHDFTNKDTRYHLKAYLVSAPMIEHLDLLVHSEFRWVALEDLSSYDFAPSDQEIVKTLLAARNNQD
ncbi:(deoxy)nucleoside triphosphate pyrophosphohydrolase [Sphaerochaeta halotolerans]|jgi:mutator protein MutT|uniref:8-oxo-dGTP diphosphatase n=1 Tax=Sphaerochaeta halotolerans TaxID=2293840 RepID=A0A372MHY1_9SPIR|nr:(deoxy)nucleoside triphosphate pyrophosphohydrolase [Sphaerochaeta halotolerans]MBG0766991.1 (deoxy)nucleoside triphosphate pyrophosphohydrolase [Spirochaetaceae bacterium]MDK2859887.1 8-oxo-dGTP diphosphatase [Sphaerochaeta sp.]MDN5333278.1 8-oxo-dGTP diphosphatase [Sphaerochaeta sp.]MXI85667.1 NUDIX domain-containing protein [Sphaerochaeta halotolerans]RFU95379.1 (deoxy)nucleoside triphosphate pyrophosphohydrolase [Sphaerochaeta halotolerans]